MPTYEYHCDACEHGFEEFQSITASPLKKCPKCGKRKLRRIFGIGAAVLFKGSGFYQTDYRSESYKSAAKAEETAKGKETAKGETKPSSNGAGKTTDTTAGSGAAGASTAKTEAKSPKS